jgi:hypothetical protein
MKKPRKNVKATNENQKTSHKMKMKMYESPFFFKLKVRGASNE